MDPRPRRPHSPAHRRRLHRQFDRLTLHLEMLYLALWYIAFFSYYPPLVSRYVWSDSLMGYSVFFLLLMGGTLLVSPFAKRSARRILCGKTRKSRSRVTPEAWQAKT